MIIPMVISDMSQHWHIGTWHKPFTLMTISELKAIPVETSLFWGADMSWLYNELNRCPWVYYSNFLASWDLAEYNWRTTVFWEAWSPYIFTTSSKYTYYEYVYYDVEANLWKQEYKMGWSWGLIIF